MSTWNIVTIKTPQAIDCDTLPTLDDLNIWDGDRFDFDDEPTASGRSKWHSDDLEIWIIDYTTKHPEISIYWYEEWDDDEPGQTLTVYRAGKIVRAESKHSALVPDNLHELVAAVRNSMGEEAARLPLRKYTQWLETAARGLVDALDPQVKP